jgi:hypothetical protein
MYVGVRAIRRRSKALLFLLFIKVGEEVVEGDTRKIDSLILMWLCVAGNPVQMPPACPIKINQLFVQLTLVLIY